MAQASSESFRSGLLAWPGLRNLLVALFLLFTVAIFVNTLIAPGHRAPRMLHTGAFIKQLDEACRVYKAEFGVFPPAAPDHDSRSLHKHLSVILRRPELGQQKDASWQVGIPIYTFSPELLKGFPDDVRPRPPLPLIDEWLRVIRYANPGQRNKDGIDIWSLGYDPSDPTDDLGNW